jgi:hypothetical protein
LKAHHLDYQHVTISFNRINALPVDEDVSSSFTAVVNGQIEEMEDYAELPSLNSYSMVPNLNITTSEVDLIFEEIAGQKRPLLVSLHRLFDRPLSIRRPERTRSLPWPSLPCILQARLISTLYDCARLT